MNEDLKVTLNRRLLKESCFGTYVLSAETFKSYMLPGEACEVVKVIDNERTVAELVDLIGASSRLDPDAARRRVNTVIDELRKLGALRLE